jgi:2-polyprenyl-6-hydroxyphenyl methylase/3-demethylubiquinone-9 3-methyltransferase
MDPVQSPPPRWQTQTRAEFVDYYARQSLTPESQERSRRLRDKLLAFHGPGKNPLDVADIGCNAGTQSRVWAELGHQVYGVDINQDLVQIAHQRLREAKLPAAFQLASATALPFPDASMDICIAPELLEHVADWETCLEEFARILRPGGVLFVSTTNRLCPVQNEFALPLYSWYPAPLKRHCERLAVTTRPELANYAAYPAVNWFTFFQLRDFLNRFGVQSYDRFDSMKANQSPLRRLALTTIRSLPPMRRLAHMLSPSTALIGRKLPA